MTRAAERVLLDTNVWLDAFLPRRVAGEVSKELIATAMRHNVDLLYPVHIVPDVFYLSYIDIKKFLQGQGQDELLAQAARTTAWEFVNTMREIATAVGADAVMFGLRANGSKSIKTSRTIWCWQQQNVQRPTIL